MDHAPWEDKAGTFARRLAREREALWVFLDIQAYVQGHSRQDKPGFLWITCR